MTAFLGPVLGRMNPVASAPVSLRSRLLRNQGCDELGNLGTVGLCDFRR
jgi:hypothetical protein